MAICQQRRLLSNQSSDKVNFPRIPTSTSTNGLLQICRQGKYPPLICQILGAPQIPPMATPLLGETCFHLASIMFVVEAAVRLREKQTVAQEVAYWKLPSVNKQVEYAPSFLITKGIPKNSNLDPFSAY